MPQSTEAQQVGRAGPAARPANQGSAATAHLPPGAPKWLPLPPEHQKYLGDVLNYWEHSTQNIKRYRCKFKRWEYEMVRKMGADRSVGFESVVTTYSEGDIKYAAPDKGLFQVSVIKHRGAPLQPGGQPQWREQQGGPREHWVCDGKSIFQFDYNNKQLIERPIPAEMQGLNIVDGPLPFMFGAKATKIQERFWIHIITPPGTKNEYWLEAVPKTREDASNFRTLHIIIAEEDFLPKAMVLFHRNNSKTTYVFENRETNWNILAQQLNPFLKQFFQPALPDRSWKKVVEPINRGPAAPPGAATARPARVPVRQAQSRRGAAPR